MDTNQARKNIKRLYLIRAIRSGMFSISIIMLFFKENGLTVQQALDIQILFSVALVLFELPTGYLADKYGRKKSIICGTLFSTLGYILYGEAYGYWGFLFAEIVLALGGAFISGADEAMLYEVQRIANNDGAIKNGGKGSSWGQLSEAVTSAIGGSVMTLVSLRFPIYFDAVLAFMALPVALTLVEAPVTKKSKESIKDMWRILKHALHEHVELKWLLISSAMAGAATLNMVWFINLYWVETKVPMWSFGILWAILQVTCAIVSRKAHWIEGKLKRKWSIVTIVSLPLLGYLGLGWTMTMWGGLFILLFYVARGMNEPIMRSYINDIICCEDRASIMSVKSFLFRAMFCVIVKMSGYVYGLISLRSVMVFDVSVFFAGAIISIIFLHKHKAL